MSLCAPRNRGRRGRYRDGRGGRSGILDTQTVAIIWGDGGKSEGVLVDPTTRRFTAEYTYQDVAVDQVFVDYSVVVTAQDKDGDASEPVLVGVRVNYFIHLDLSGWVFEDKDNNSVYNPVAGDAGIRGVSVQLVSQDTGAVVATAVTDDGGAYRFDVA